MQGHDNLEALKQGIADKKLEPPDHPWLGLIELARIDLDAVLTLNSTQDLTLFVGPNRVLSNAEFAHNLFLVIPMLSEMFEAYRQLDGFSPLRQMAGGTLDPLRQVLLDKARAQMDVHLDQWTIPDGFEAVNFAGLDDEDIAGATFKCLPVHGPESAALPDKLDFIVGMSVWARAFARQRAQ
jgi:hypothetical protein